MKSELTPEEFMLAQEVFEEVCDLSAEQREARIDAMCGGQPEVRRLVDSLLVEDARTASDPVVIGGLEGVASLRELTDLPARALPESVGPYRIVRECGHGGMGTVFEALQEHPRRRVAVKLLRAGSLEPALLTRFRQEAEILGRLQHPGIAQIHDAGTHELDGAVQPFFAMEFIEGESLLDYARRERLDRRQRLILFTRVCDAVHYAHQRGVIHRDLKPDNILVVPPSTETETGTGGGTTFGGEALAVGQPKILDFGVARVTDSDVEITMMSTNVGQLIGTIQYMSPEQASGDSTVLDERSDIYALGVILYELMAERSPYDLRQLSIPDAALRIREEEPTRLGAIDTSLRGDVETIARKALEKEPDRRYATVADLSSDVRRYLQDEPIAARPPSARYQLVKFARRNRAVVAGLVATFSVLVVGVVAATILAVRSNRSEAAALRQAYRASITAASALVGQSPKTAARHLEEAPPQHRGWEWQHLFSQLTRHVKAFVPPEPLASNMAVVTGDGRHVAAALASEGIAVWNIEEADLVQRLSTGARVTALAVAGPSVARLAAGTEDGRVVIFDLDGEAVDEWGRGAARVELDLGEASAMRIAWDRSGERLAISGKGTVWTWSGTDGLRALTRLSSTVGDGLAFTPSGTELVGILERTNPRSVFTLDVETGELQGIWTDVGGPSFALPSVDGESVFVAFDQRVIQRHDSDSFELTDILAGHQQGVKHLAASPDGSLVASAGLDGTIRLWDAKSGSPREVISVSGSVRTAFAPDGKSLVFVDGGEVRLWDLSVEPSRVLRGHTSYLYQIDFDPEGRRLASTSPFVDELKVWDTSSGRELLNLARRAKRLLAFVEGGERLLVDARRFDATTGRELEGEGPLERAYAPGRRLSPVEVCSHMGRWRTVGDQLGSGDVRLLDAATGEVERDFHGLYWGAAFSPDDALIALAGRTGHVEIRRPETGELVARLEGHSGEVYCVDFLPDGSRLASGGNDNVIRLWDTKTWEQVIELRGHGGYVKAVAFSPDGTQLASASGDFTVRLWDTLTCLERAARR